MLKLETIRTATVEAMQPPSGGCVLKLGVSEDGVDEIKEQPPSGGCVLKPFGGMGNAQHR